MPTIPLTRYGPVPYRRKGMLRLGTVKMDAPRFLLIIRHCDERCADDHADWTDDALAELPGMSREMLLDVCRDELGHLEHADLLLAAEDHLERVVRVEHDLLFGNRLEALPNPRRSGAQSSLTKDSGSAHRIACCWASSRPSCLKMSAVLIVSIITETNSSGKSEPVQPEHHPPEYRESRVI